MEHKNMMHVIDETIKNELTHAKSKFPDFVSGHEGYAILLEEIDELMEEMDNLFRYNKELWKSVKSDDKSLQKENIEYMKSIIRNVIKEAVQVGAMCERYSDDVLSH